MVLGSEMLMFISLRGMGSAGVRDYEICLADPAKLALFRLLTPAARARNHTSGSIILKKYIVIFVVKMLELILFGAYLHSVTSGMLIIQASRGWACRKQGVPP